MSFRFDRFDPEAEELEDYLLLVDKLKKRLPEIFNVRGQDRAVSLENVTIDLPDDVRDYREQQNIKDKNGTYSVPVKGDFVFRDANGNESKRISGATIVKMPLPTGRGTFIIDGHEYSIRKQLRLKPGVYVTHQKDGVQAFVNTSTRQNMKISLDPEGIMQLTVGAKSFPIYPVLSALGISDSEMRNAWGQKIFDKNATGNTQKVVDRLHATMYMYGGKAKDYAGRVDEIAKALTESDIDPWTSKITLGRSYHSISPELLLQTSGKMLDVSSGKAKPDRRDALYFKQAHGFDDIIDYGLAKARPLIQRKLLDRLNNPVYDDADVIARPVEGIRGIVGKTFTQADLSFTPDQVNPIGMKSDANELTYMGEGGIGSDFSIAENTRKIDDSMMGFIDPVQTPTSYRVGVNMHMAATARKIHGDIAKAVWDLRSGEAKPAMLTAKDAYDQYVAVPGQFSTKNGRLVPRSSTITVLHNGEFTEVPSSKVTHYLGNESGALSYGTLLIPFLGNDTPIRASMSVKQSTHALPLKNREVPLVQSVIGDEKDGSPITADNYFYKKLIRRVPSYIDGGEVVKVDPNEIWIKEDKTGETHKIQIYNNFALNSESVLHDIPVVSVGDKVSAGQPLAENNFTRDGNLAMGMNLRIAYIPYKGLNFMDGLVVSESAAKKMAVERLYREEHSRRKNDVFSKKTFTAHYPGLYSKQALDKLDDDGVVTPGTVVKKGDPLVLKMSPRQLTEDDIIRGNVSTVFKSPLARDEKIWEHDVDGVVDRVVKESGHIKVFIRSEEPAVRGDKLCLSGDHEYLTERGWVPAPDLTMSDMVCTLNQSTGSIEYQKPEAVYSYHHVGKMYGIRSQQIDLLTTLNHNMLVRQRGSSSFALLQAQDIMGKRVRYKKDGRWIGREGQTFVLPSVDSHHHGCVPQILPEVAMDDWLEFLGYYIADGHYSKDGYYVTVNKCASTKNSYGGHVYPKIIACLDRMGWPYNPREDKIIISSRQLNDYLSKLGHASDKRIPRDLMDLSQRQMGILLDALLSYDGSRSSCVSYSTTSKHLADDVQEVALKAGMAANVTTCSSDGNEAHAGRFRVSIIRKKAEPMVNHGHTKSQHAQEEGLVDYDGMVYCCTVPNHVLYVRRNGKACWTGNSNRHQAKGVIVSVIPDEEMPHFADGSIPDILQNPAAVPSRANLGQVLETGAAKIALKQGKPYTARAFSEDNSVSKVYNEMQSLGLSDTEQLYDPDGTPIGSPVLAGHQYFTRQKQQAEKYFQVRNREDPYDIVSRRPIRGPKVGPLGFYALLAHGATENLREIAGVKSELNDDFWRAVETNEPLPTPKNSFAFDKLQAMMNAAGINMRREGADYRLIPLVDEDIASMSSGEVPDPGRAVRVGQPGRYDMLQPQPGGLYDRKIFGGLNGDKWGHITLATPMPNPVFENAIRAVTGLTQDQFKGLVSGEYALSGTSVVENDGSSGLITGPEAFRVMLKKINPSEDLKAIKAQMPTAKGTTRDSLVKKARYLNGLMKSGLTAEQAYLLSSIPVLPPIFRPVYLGDKGQIRISDLTMLYQDLGRVNDTLKEAGAKGVPSQLTRTLRTDLYDAMKAVQATGTGQGAGGKPRLGALSYLKGINSPTGGHFQDKIFSKRQSVGGRAVIMANPGLSVDEVGIPEDMAWSVYKSFVMRRLAGQGLSALEAKKAIDTRTGPASDALNLEMKERPVLLTRDPRLHKFNHMAFWPRRIPGYAIEMPPLVVIGFNADFDGDAMGVSVPVTAEAVKEARTKMFPSQNLFKAGRDTIIMKPEEESIAGLYLATRVLAPTDKRYTNASDVIRDYRAGSIKVHDGIHLNGKLTTPGRVVINEVLPSDMRSDDMVLDSKGITSLLDRVAKTHPNSYTKVLERLKDLGDHFAYREGMSFSMRDFVELDTPELEGLKPGQPLTAQQRDAIRTRLRKAVPQTSALALLAESGAKGSWDKIQDLLYSPIGFTDVGGGEVVPRVIRRGFSKGLDWQDYWAAAKGARHGLFASSVEVRDPGYFSKQLMRSTLGMTVLPGDSQDHEGISYSVNHPTVLNRYLAEDVVVQGKTLGKAGDPVTSEIVNAAKKAGVNTFMVRSPLTSMAEQGLYARDFGRLPGNVTPQVGTDLGVISGHTLTEPAVQLALKSRHGAGAVDRKGLTGLYAIWPILNGMAPPGHKAALSPFEGTITKTERTKAGNFVITLDNGETITTPPAEELWVSKGQKVKRGQQLHEGYPDPKEVLELRGLRDLQMYLVEELEKNYGNIAPDRRYLETVVAGLTRYGVVEDPGERDDLMPGDIVNSNSIMKYNNGLKTLQKPVGFKPLFVGMDMSLPTAESDWSVKMLGRDMIHQIEEAAAMGLTSSTQNPKPIMPFVYGLDFGRRLSQSGEY